jgi:hypothetical protein
MCSEAKQKVRRNYGNSFLSPKLCLFWQDLNLAHDAEEQRAVVSQLDGYCPALT